MQVTDAQDISDFDLIARTPSARCLDFSVGNLLTRSFHELRPRKFHTAKLAASLALQVPRPYSFGSQWQMDVFCDELIGLPQDLHRLVPLSPKVHVCSLNCSEFLDRISETNAHAVMIAEGDYRAPRDMAQVSLANILDGINRSFREQALRLLAAQAADLEVASRKSLEIIVQERPGRFTVLPGMEATLKNVQKRISTDLANLIAKRDHKEPSQVHALDGWGAGSVALCPSKYGRSFASATLRLRGHEFGLEMMNVITEQVFKWTAVMTGSEEIESFWIAVPHVSIAGQLMSLIQKRNGSREVNFRLDDLLLGWNPLLTAMQFLQSESKLPAVLIVLDQFPNVEFAALWK